MSRRDADPREPVPCRSCGALMIWAKNAKSGKPMPFDAEPDPELTAGWVLVYRQSSSEVIATYQADPAPGARLRVPHFTTCPNADQHRRKS